MNPMVSFVAGSIERGKRTNPASSTRLGRISRTINRAGSPEP